MGDFHITIFQNLFPLRGSFIGEQMVFSPEGVSSLDESEDAMGVHIVGVTLKAVACIARLLSCLCICNASL